MQMWIVTVGWYEDMKLVGVARSEVEAGQMIEKARQSGKFKWEETFGSDPAASTYETTGPFTPGEI